MNPLLLALYARYGLEPSEANREALRAAVAKAKAATRAGMMAPRTVDAEARTIETVVATEDPVEVWDYERWEPVDEVLLMKGARLAKVRKGKLPLLDAHMRDTTRRVLGSVIDLRVDGPELVGTEVYSALSEPEFVKATEGHLDQRSVGYRIFAATYIKPGESATVEGKPFAARPGRGLSVVTDWIPLECSVVPIGADPASGTRAIEPISTVTPEPKESVPAMKITAELRARLVSLGMPETATDEEAVAFLAKPETQRALVPPPAALKQEPKGRKSDGDPDPNTADAEKRLAALEAKVAAREQTAQVESVFRAYLHLDGVDALRTKALQDNLDVAGARGILLEHLPKSTPAAGRAVITKDAVDHLRANGIQAVYQRANPSAKVTDAERQQAADFRHMSLLDLARHCLEAAGVSTRGMDQMEVARLALSQRSGMNATGDYPHILSSTANKSLQAAYAMAPQTWTRWCKRGSLSDFKATPRVAMSDAGVLPSVPEGGEFGQYSVTDTAENIQLGTFGKIFAVTRQAVINDDMDAFGTIPTKHARAWSRTINQAPVRVLLANAALHDTGALCNATAITTAGGHANLSVIAAVTTKATAEAVIRACKILLAAQMDADGESFLQITPALMLVPPATAQWYIQAVYETGVAASNRQIDIARLNLEVIEEPELSNASLSGYASDNEWMFANPLDAPVLEVAFLNGNDAPYLEMQTGFEIDGIKMKVRGDVAAKAIDFRGVAGHNPT